MIMHANETSVRFLWLARKSLPGRFCGLLAVAIIALAASGISLSAQEPELGVEPNTPESTVPDIADGKAIAGKLCVGCHLIDQTSGGATAADVPSFPSVANRPRQSIDVLSNWLMAPHAPMPDPHLTRKEIRDLAGYIISLRTEP
jgi:mono/diheme cytochrome c family protein